MYESLIVRVPQPAERAEALRLVFQDRPPAQRTDRVTHTLKLMEQGAFDPAGLLIASQGESLVGAMVCQVLPGASALVWPPQTCAGPASVQAEDALVAQAKDWLRSNGVKLGQALLDADSGRSAASLLRNGFQLVTQLNYLRHGLELSAAFLAGEERLTYESYRQADPMAFEATLLQTYEGTADFPEINDVRTIEEIMAGHRAQGMHDPERWWLASDRGVPVGVLLLAVMEDSWDVSYVGVIPGARGRGFGTELMHKALVEAKVAEISQLTLTVDARNHGAVRLYRRLGFEVYDHRSVFLAIWKAL